MNVLELQHRIFAPLRAPRMLALGCLLAAAALACSDSDADPLADGAPARPRDAGRDDAAVDAAAPTTDTGAEDRFDGSCGGRMCPVSGLGTPGCCTAPGTAVSGHMLENTGRAPGLCGTDVSPFFAALEGICVQLDQPGAIDSECPAQEQLGGGVIMPGCCTDEGYCGSMENLIGFGCFYATGRKGRPCAFDSEADGGR